MGKKTNQKNRSDFITQVVNEIESGFRANQTLLSFDSYMTQMLSDPQRYLRSSAQYLVDAIDYFGSTQLHLPTGTVTRFHLFDAPFADGSYRVAGQEAVQEQIYRLLASFARAGRSNKMLLLHGPNGSAKSSLVRCLMAGLEHYGTLPEGVQYSFNWIFPARQRQGEHIGFGGSSTFSTHQNDGGNSSDRSPNSSPNSTYAFLSADDVDARIPCEMHDHPLFLIPLSQRDTLLDGTLLKPNKTEGSGFKHGAAGEEGRMVSDYLRKGDLCHKCRRIFDALLANYDGDASQVFKHIQVERFYPSYRYRRGAATIEPQQSVDARATQITADRSAQALPKALQHVSLYEPSGPLVAANRGILEFSDLLKRPVESFKYLLETIETATVSMDTLVLHFDLLFIASTNETYLDAFKEHPDFPSFKGRMELIKVPYLRRYGIETEIYQEQLNATIIGQHIAPHAIQVAARWAVLTRLKHCSGKDVLGKNFGDLTDVVKALTPLEKLTLFDTGEVPTHLSSRDATELKQLIPQLYQESQQNTEYEGRYGASAREIRTALLSAAHNNNFHCLSPLAVFAELQDIVAAKSVFRFLKQKPDHGFHEHQDFLEQIEHAYLDLIDREIQESMGLTQTGSHKILFTHYVSHISCALKEEKLLDDITGKFVEPDQKLMQSVEKVLLAKGESATDFRRTLIGAIGAHSLDQALDQALDQTREDHTEEHILNSSTSSSTNHTQAMDLAAIFPHYIEQLRDDFFASRRDELRTINKQFLHFSETLASNTNKKKKTASNHSSLGMLNHLKSKYGYCQYCAHDAVSYLLKKRYLA